MGAHHRLTKPSSHWISTVARNATPDQKRIPRRGHSKAQAGRICGSPQKRLDVMYEDRLDGRIDVSLFERKSAEYRQVTGAQVLAKIDGFGAEDGHYMEGRHPSCSNSRDCTGC